MNKEVADVLANRFAALWDDSDDVPCVFEFLERHSDAPLRQRANVILIDQYQRWKAGKSIASEQYIDRVKELASDEEILVELIAEEFGYLEESSEPVDAESFLQRFSSLSDSAQGKLHQLIGGDVSASEQDHLATRVAATDSGASDAMPLQIGRYALLRQLGAGSFGVVYLAQDDELQRSVAIKVPTRTHVHQVGGADAFLREAQVVARLDHPNIVPVYDVGTLDDGQCFVVSKHIDGQDAAREIAAGVAPSRAARLIAIVARALHYAHRSGLVHRDIKPANILLDRDDKPYLVDFGLALKDEEYGRGSRLVGTPAYMSPEQARGEGHRVDARSDIYSLGVVLYEMLTGRRPHRGKTASQLIEQIKLGDVRPPRQIDDRIPRDLDRICLRALARRVSERYSTALDLAEELESFLSSVSSDQVSTRASTAPPARRNNVDTSQTLSDSSLTAGSSGLTHHSGSSKSDGLVKIVPKGLRSFDGTDAEFFMGLLPGPKDRNGLPEGIRFWKQRIEQTSASSFAVGLMYGPSGCGKSSLVKAGLLPVLDPQVRPIYVEASSVDTEQRLLRGLRTSFADLPEGSLADSIGHLRRCKQSKVLLVIDQFEQWLHGWNDAESHELVDAIRQCDGPTVQALVLVRDDFWMAATRFMREVEVPLLEGDNSAAVDLFDLRHARKVLRAYGQAFEALPGDTSAMTKSQQRFMMEAVDGLATGGKVIPVRIALFSEMMKSRSWDTATLKTFGGIGGIGVAFLEESFGDGAAPQRRLHARGARRVLQALLPEVGSSIKGVMLSRGQLQAAAGYQQPSMFDELLRVLDDDLRLLTPSERESAPSDSDRTGEASLAAEQRSYYQLTHDYLVPAIRRWLERGQQTTMQGRAELRLQQRAALWQQKPEPSLLPSAWEFASFRLLTRRKEWTETQTRMMAEASHRHWLRAAIALGLAIVLCLFGWDARRRMHASGLYQQLMVAKTADVPDIVNQLGSVQNRARPALVKTAEDPAATTRQRLHAALALVDQDRSQVGQIADYLLEAQPDEFPVLVDALLPYRAEVRQQLWQGSQAGGRSQRLNAAAALAVLDQSSGRWHTIARQVAADLVDSPFGLSHNLARLEPVGSRLVSPLIELARSDNPEQKNAATEALKRFLPADSPQLVDLLEHVDAQQFRTLLPRLDELSPGSLAELEKRLAAPRFVPWADAAEHEANPLPPALVNRVQQAAGMVQPSFVICQSLPLAETRRLTDDLAQHGYRPVKLRPYPAAAGLLLAGIWIRDELKWDVAVDVAEAQVRAENRQREEQSLLVEDIAGYLPADQDQPRFVLVWAESKDPGARREFHFGVQSEEHYALKQVYQAKGLHEMSRHLFTTRDGYWLIHSMIWGMKAQHIEDAFFYNTRNLSLFNRLTLAVDYPEDVAITRARGEDSDDIYVHYSGIWRYRDLQHESIALTKLTPIEHLSRARELAAEGYRPKSISVAELDPAYRECASIWHRPLIPPQIQDRYARERSNIAATLLRQGRTHVLLKLLADESDVALQTELIHMFQSHGFGPQLLLELLSSVDSDTLRRNLMLALGEFEIAEIPADLRATAIRQAADLYETHPDSGIHSAARWCLTRWGETDDVEALVQAGKPFEPDRAWYVDGQGHTLAVIDLSQQTKPFVMGGPFAEEGISWDERRHEKWIRRKFAIGTTEVTVGQFARFMQANPEVGFAQRNDFAENLPQTRTNWFQAALYCNWLSQAEGIPKEQWCFEVTHDPDSGPQFSLAKDYLSRTGYRLPTEAEWEFACRASALTTRPFGQSAARLKSFAWYAENSEHRLHPVAQLQPNRLGMFDALGNAREWVLELWGGLLTRSRAIINSDHEDRRQARREVSRITKGGSFREEAVKLRSANRIGKLPYIQLDTFGFRVGRTLPVVAHESPDNAE